MEMNIFTAALINPAPCLRPREGAELQRGAEMPRLSLGPIKLLRHLVPQTGLTTRAVQIPTQMGMGS